MSIRKGFKKAIERIFWQVRVPADLACLVDAQIEKDLRSGLRVDRTIVTIESLKNYLKESGVGVKDKT